MDQSRRIFIAKASLIMASSYLPGTGFLKAERNKPVPPKSKGWIELSEEAYQFNANRISQLSGNMPVLAVLKNNAYGLGAIEVSRILDKSKHIFGIAVVTDERAMTIRSAGVDKPILLMGDFEENMFRELVKADITLSVFSQESLQKILTLAGKSTVKVALYIDTGLGRMGIPFEEVFSVVKKMVDHKQLTISQSFTTLTTPRLFAQEQLARFQSIMSELASKGIHTGIQHAAPSFSLLDVPESHLDMVRPGIMLHGTYPMAKMEEAQQTPLKLTYKLKAPIIRLEQLKKGDTIGFSRFYPLKEAEWIATLPIGWADGYDSGAENGARVYLNGQLYPVVNVNASHTNVSLGKEKTAKIGEVATLIGPEKPEISPEGFAKLIGGHNYMQIQYKESIPKFVYESF